MSESTPSATETPRRHGPGAITPMTLALCVSAALLLAFVVVRAGPLLAPARGDLVASAGEYTMMTFDAGNDDVLLVLDSRAEQLFAYRVRNQNSFELIEPYDLKDMFVRARRVGIK